MEKQGSSFLERLLQLESFFLPMQKLGAYRVRFLGGHYDDFVKQYEKAKEVEFHFDQIVIDQFVTLLKIKTPLCDTVEYKTAFRSSELTAEEVIDDLMTLISDKDCLVKKCDELIFHTGTTKKGLKATLVFSYTKQNSIALVAAYPMVKVSEDDV